LAVNDYFEDFAIVDTFPIDTFPVFYEDSLFFLNVIHIETSDSLEFNMESVSRQAENIEYLNIRLIIENGYPTSSLAQVFFENESGLLIDSLLPSRKFIKPGKVNEKEKVIESSYNKVNVEFNKSRIRSLYEADKIRFYASVLVTSDDLQTVKFYQEYKVKAKMGIQAKLKMEPSDF
jgi:hypothetical protein